MADETGAIDDSGFTMETGIVDHDTMGNLIINEAEEAKTKLRLEARLFPEVRFRAGKAQVWGGPVTLNHGELAEILTAHHPICLDEGKRAEVLSITGGKDGGVRVRFLPLEEEDEEETESAEDEAEDEAADEPEEEATT